MVPVNHVFRSLGKSPGFTLVAVLTLALGIGATTAIFSVVHALLLSPLQYGSPGELVQLQSRHPEQGVAGLAPATFGDIAANNRSFASLAAQYYYYVNLTGTETPALLNSADVTAEYFKLFDVAPLRGRVWNAGDFKPGAAPVVVLGHALWSGRFNSSDAVIGQSIKLDGIAYTVIGVMPASFKEPSDVAQLWRPMQAGADNLLERSSRYWTVYGRLNPGVTATQADAELSTIARQLEIDHSQHYRGWKLQTADLRRLVVGDYRQGLLIVLAAAGCVLLITCANVAGLSIARAVGRRKEMAIRTALGSSRAELIVQLLSESMLLAILGGVTGVLFASWGLDALLNSLPPGWLPRSSEISLNLPVLGAALAITGFTGLACGLMPAFGVSQIDANDALKDSARGSPGPSAQRLRAALIIGEIALALVLLASTGLLCRSFVGLLQRKSGVDAGNVLSLTVSLSAKKYDSPARCWDFFSRAQTEVAAVPGVDAAGFTQTSPFRWGIPVNFTPLPASAPDSAHNLPPAFTDSVSVDYFKALGIPLRAGRTFTAADDYRVAPITIISETTARRYFGEKNPIGQVISSGSQANFEVVGVVGDVRRSGLTVDLPLQVYRPLAQRTPPFATLMVRTSLPPATLTKSIQAALWRVDADVPVSEVATLDTYVSRSVTQPRLYLTLFSSFALLALLLAGIGLYGLVRYSVEQRTREFGIRSALGATPRKILTLVIHEGAMLIGSGLALGLVGSFATVRLLRGMIYETSPHDPIVFLLVPGVLTAVALVACWLPARHAAKVDPVEALRAE